jgi:hypothetical protein
MASVFILTCGETAAVLPALESPLRLRRPIQPQNSPYELEKKQFNSFGWFHPLAFPILRMIAWLPGKRDRAVRNDWRQDWESPEARKHA